MGSPTIPPRASTMALQILPRLFFTRWAERLPYSRNPSPSRVAHRFSGPGGPPDRRSRRRRELSDLRRRASCRRWGLPGAQRGSPGMLRQGLTVGPFVRTSAVTPMSETPTRTPSTAPRSPPRSSADQAPIHPPATAPRTPSTRKLGSPMRPAERRRPRNAKAMPTMTQATRQIAALLTSRWRSPSRPRPAPPN